jgi:hypothetical protein
LGGVRRGAATGSCLAGPAAAGMAGFMRPAGAGRGRGSDPGVGGTPGRAGRGSRTAGDRPAVGGVELDRLAGKDPLQQQGVDIDERGLQQVQGEHAGFLSLAVGPGELDRLQLPRR